MAFRNGLAGNDAENRRPVGAKSSRRGSVKVLTVDRFNVVEVRRDGKSDLRWVGRLLCYTSAILSFGLAVAFGLTVV